MEKVLDLILQEQKETRKDIRTLYEKMHKVDKRMSNNGLKITGLVSLVTVVFSIAINFVNKKFIN